MLFELRYFIAITFSFSKSVNCWRIQVKLNFLQVHKSVSAIHEKGFNFDDSRLMRGAWRNEPDPDACKVCYFLVVFIYINVRACNCCCLVGMPLRLHVFCN